MAANGFVTLVGAGPGDPDLLTLRAAKRLAEADIVFYDALVDSQVLDLAPSARRVFVGKRAGREAVGQPAIHRLMIRAARRGQRVVRLKGGDPMLFGRAHEEISFLEPQGIRVEVVPGVTAALAASAQLGISLTRRGAARSVTFVTPRVGHGERESSWVAAVLAADTAAIYMGAGEARAIAAALIAAGKPANTPIALVEDASLPGTRVQYAALQELPTLTTSGVPA